MPNKDPFDEFMTAEYSNISQAHFNTVESISEFFKAYIAIVSLPISAAVIFLKPEELKQSGVLAFFTTNPTLVLITMGLVVLVGWCVLAYIINLRCDALLYARTVNGIRKYFYENKLDVGAQHRYLVLPKQTHLPHYWETRYFLFVVLAFAAIGTAYWSVGLIFYYGPNSYAEHAGFWVLLLGCVSIHFILYWRLTRHREDSYLKTRILGVDIDGVLNDHRTHFCAVLQERVNKHLNPADIKKIPVHTIDHTDVTADDEQAVFNWPPYWVDMPAVQGVDEFIKRIRNELGYRIWIFTHRPWPKPKAYPKGRAPEYDDAWNRAWDWSWMFLTPGAEHLGRWLNEKGIANGLTTRPIRVLTRRWLEQHAIRYNRLTVENDSAVAKNRFTMSVKIGIRAFVEDELEKAKRLCDVCDVVFIIDQPYNQEEKGSAASKNLIRVKGWEEVYSYLRWML
jgi:uncharacterized HAD superfamily protein